MRFITIPALFTFVISLSAQVNFTTTNLPIIFIKTNGSQIQDEPKIKADMSIIYNGPGMLNKISDIPNEYNGKIGIELRGHHHSGFRKSRMGLRHGMNSAKIIMSNSWECPRKVTGRSMPHIMTKPLCVMACLIFWPGLSWIMHRGKIQ